MTKGSITGFLLCVLTVGGVAVACSSPILSPTPIPAPIESPPPSPFVQSPVEPTLPFQSPLVQSPVEPILPFQSPVETQSSEATTLLVEMSSEVPIPEAGKASISGVLYNFSGHDPIPETVFYLTPAVGEGKQDPPHVFVGPREEQGDIQGMSDTQGRIFLNNVPPGSYYLAVWAPYNWILAVESATDPTPRLIVLEPNQRENLGTVYLSWP